MKRFKFYREENRWYVFLPEYPGERDDLEMVLGADTMLDIFSQGEGEVKIDLSIEKTEYSDSLTLNHLGGDEGGGWYQYKSKDNLFDFELWLCDVTKWVFGKMPKNIWLNKC